MLLNKIKVGTVALLLSAVFSAGEGLIYQTQATEPKAQRVTERVKAPKTEEADKETQSNQGEDKLQGMWLRMAVQGSVPQLDEDWRFQKGKVIFLNRKAVRSAEELKRWGKATYKLDVTQTPRTIDLKLEDGKKVRGIYLLVDDVLVICLSKAGAARPSQFTADTEAGQELLQFHRQQPKGGKPTK